MCVSELRPANEEPSQTAAIAPTVYWPWPPMLKRPQRNANATARPVRISGVVRISVCWRLSSATVRSAPVTQGKNQFRPLPSKIASYVRSGFLPVVTRTTSPPMRKATSAVSTGVRTPPARWNAAMRAATLGA